jgi:protein TonB
VIVEMVPTPSVARVDSPDVAHGPLMEEATLTPQAAKETKEDVEKETPPVEPSPLAPEPEVVLPMARPVPEKKPEEELPKDEVPKQQSADQTTAAPLTTAPPRVDASSPTRAVAPSPGSSASVARVQANWQKALVKHLDRFKR